MILRAMIFPHCETFTFTSTLCELIRYIMEMWHFGPMYSVKECDCVGEFVLMGMSY